MAVPQVKIAVSTFLLYLFLILYIFYVKRTSLLQWIVPFEVIIFGILTLLQFFVPYSSVRKRSAFLGSVFGLGILLNIDLFFTKWKYMGWYMCVLSIFHFSEYIMTALYNADKLSLDSFLLNHSFEYKVAAIASWLEFFMEIYLFPVLKQQLIPSCIGLCLVVFGELMRKVAMVTAKSNFTHLIQYRKRDEHVLVTWGVYNWCRHPGYVGFFYWSIGTQMILCNPVCVVAYSLASWHFFNDRILEEECYLVEFFGEEYRDYQKRIKTGLPFIHGYT